MEHLPKITPSNDPQDIGTEQPMRDPVIERLLASLEIDQRDDALITSGDVRPAKLHTDLKQDASVVGRDRAGALERGGEHATQRHRETCVDGDEVDDEFEQMLARLENEPEVVATGESTSPPSRQVATMQSAPSIGLPEPGRSDAAAGAEASPAKSASACPAFMDASKFPFDAAVLDLVGDPAADLERLCREACATVEDYERIRGGYCHASIQLNLLGRIAPAFRPNVRVKARTGAQIYTMLLRDQLMIDYHWCHATRMDLTPSESDHAACWDIDKDFQFDQMWKLCRRKWRATFRAEEALGLSTFEQCQTLHLRGLAVQDRDNGIVGGYRESNESTRIS